MKNKTAAKYAAILPVGHSYHDYSYVDPSTIVEQGVAVSTPPKATREPTVSGALQIQRMITTPPLLAEQLQIDIVFIVFDDLSGRRNPHGME